MAESGKSIDVLLLGSGAREHALAWKLTQSPKLGKLWAAPGNPGIARHAELVSLDIAVNDAVVAFAREKGIGLVVVGPELPLVNGLVDALEAEGLRAFGPTAAAARLEGSKGFTKDLCARAGIPTADYVRVSDEATAREALDRFSLPVVIKADGLAAGKGVVIASTRPEAEQALATMFGGAFGAAGAEVVIEEYLEGEEVSLFAICDGHSLLVLGSGQDHKRLRDGDTGPNTGGMGSYSPATILTSQLESQAVDEILHPTLLAMTVAGAPFAGILYAGLMLTADGPKLIEYNVRFGDPEAEVLLARMTDDLLVLMLYAVAGKLDARSPVKLAEQAALTVVVAAEGYPGMPRIGGAVRGVAAAEATGALVFQAGTRNDGDGLVASGGRVLAVTGRGRDIVEAQAAAYRAIGCIEFDGGFWRHDIGWRAVARERRARGDE